jgi:SagB-type dehydrogenase family enzyme
MSQNDEISIARKYHQATKHSPIKIQRESYKLDWVNKPEPFKSYPDLEPIELPTALPDTGVSALRVVAQVGEINGSEANPNLSQIAYVLYYSAGITKKMVFPQETIYFRAAACAGALYPIEIYIVCGDLLELSAGVYHFSPADFALRRLRRGDYRGILHHATGQEPNVTHAPVILLFTAITWRSAWKYRARSYRYHFWDNGTILANAMAASTALRLPHRLVMGFVDKEVNYLLGIDGQDEKTLAIFPLGYRKEEAREPKDVPDINLAVESLSREKIEYPLIEELHQFSTLSSPESVRAWRAKDFPSIKIGKQGEEYRLAPLDVQDYPKKSIEEVILKRGSSRRFKPEAISLEDLSTMFQVATQGFPKDWGAGDRGFLNDLFIIVHAVEGLPAGAYRLDPHNGHLNLLGEGNFRRHSAHLCLGQRLGGSASATVYYIADLELILEKYGNRGYRLAQMEAGITGGKLYLAAYALGHGATGLTFFDDEIVDFFFAENAREEAIFVTALGKPASPLQSRGHLEQHIPGEKVKI